MRPEPLQEPGQQPAADAAATAVAGRSVHRSILRALFAVGAATAVVRLLALARELLVSRQFGVGSDVDAFVIALLVPTFAVAVLAESLNASLLPTYARLREAEGEEAERLLAGVVAFAGTALTGCCLLLALAAPLLVDVVAPGFDEPTAQLTVQLMWIMLPLVVFSGVASIWTAALTSGERFLLPSLAPACIPIAAGAAVLLLADRHGVYALAGGTVLGYALQLVPLLIVVRRVRLPVVMSWRGISHHLRAVGGQYLPLALGTFLNSGGLLVDQAIASSLGDGSVSVLYYGNRLVALVTGVLGVAIGTAVLPYFSRQSAQQDWQGLARTIRVWSLGVAAAAGVLSLVLILASHELIALMFQGGEFDAAATAEVSTVQIAYLLQLPMFAVGIIAARALSALRGNRVLLWGAAVNLVVNIVLDIVLAKAYGVTGIALATSAVYLVSIVFLMLMLRRRLRGLLRAEAAAG
jgi:putative peptidoglycan lipid II flippase